MGTQGTVGQDLFQTKNRSVRKTGGKASTCTKVQVLQNETGREADRWKLNNLTDTKKSCEASTTTTYTVHFMWLIKALSDIVQT